MNFDYIIHPKRKQNNECQWHMQHALPPLATYDLALDNRHVDGFQQSRDRDVIKQST